MSFIFNAKLILSAESQTKQYNGELINMDYKKIGMIVVIVVVVIYAMMQVDSVRKALDLPAKV